MDNFSRLYLNENKRTAITISKRMFENSRLHDVPKTSRNQTWRQLESLGSPEKKTPLSPNHREMRVRWVRKYMKLAMKYLLFTDESPATFYGPDSWGKRYVFNETFLSFAGNKVADVKCELLGSWIFLKGRVEGHQGCSGYYFTCTNKITN